MKKLIFILLFSTCAFGQFSAPTQTSPLGLQINWAHPYSKGLIGCWLFNEGSGDKVYDLTHNGQDGTFGAGAASPLWTTGEFGNATYFDGGDYITLAHNILPTNAVSIVAWVKGKTISDLPTILAWKNTSAVTKGIWWAVDFQGGGGTPDVYFYVQGVGNNTANLVGAGSLNDGKWHQHAVTYDGSLIEYWLDGTVRDSDVDSGTISYANGTTSFIGVASAGNYEMVGDISLVCLYDRGLDASEIADLYINPFCFMQPSWNWVLYGGIAAPAAGNIPIFMYHYTNH
jgi:hypothetical protein